MHSQKLPSFCVGQHVKDKHDATGNILTVTFVNTRFERILYECEDGYGMQFRIFESNLETVFSHDKRVGLLNR